MKDISILVVASPRRRILPLLVKSITLPGNSDFIGEVIINPLNNEGNEKYKMFEDILSRKGILLKIVNVCRQSHPLGYCKDRLAKPLPAKYYRLSMAILS